MKKIHILFILLSIQNISFAQNSNTYEVYAIRFAKGESRVPLSFAAAGASNKDSVQFCEMFWMLVGNGKHILVDAGFTLTEFSKEWDSIYIRPDSALLRMGVKATDISDIIITHPHNDHIGGINLFPSAQIWMQKDDYDYFVGAAYSRVFGPSLDQDIPGNRSIWL